LQCDVGGLGVLWLIILWLFLIYDTPAKHRRIDPNERDYIISYINQSINQSIIYLRTQAAIMTWNKGKNESVQQDRKVVGLYLAFLYYGWGAP